MKGLLAYRLVLLIDQRFLLGLKMSRFKTSLASIRTDVKM